MAIAISSTVSFKSIRMEFEASGSGNTLTKTTLVSGTADNTTDITPYLTALSNVSNAGLIRGSVNGEAITGWPAAVNGLQNLVAAAAVLGFIRTNPVDASKKVFKSFVIPAYKNSSASPVSKNIRTDAGAIDSVETNIAAIIGFLESNLVMKGADGAYYTGSWTYDPTQSGFMTIEMSEIE